MLRERWGDKKGWEGKDRCFNGVRIAAGECELIRGGILCLVFHVCGLVLGLTFLLPSLLRCANEEGLAHAWWFWMKWMVTQRGGDPDSALWELYDCSFVWPSGHVPWLDHAGVAVSCQCIHHRRLCMLPSRPRWNDGTIQVRSMTCRGRC